MKFNLLSILMLMLNGCAVMPTSVPISMQELRPTGEIKNKLPSLEPTININSLESAYTKGKSSTYVSGYATSIGGGIVAVGSARTTHFSDKRINDALTLIERDVKDNITNYIGEVKGTIEFHITYSNSRIVVLKDKVGKKLLQVVIASGTVILGAFLIAAEQDVLGSIFIIGGITYVIAAKSIEMMKGKPTYYIQEIEIEAIIKDTMGNPVARYIGAGEASVEKNETDINDPFRRPNIYAIQEAMKEVKKQIDRDYFTIMEKFKN